MIHAIIRDLNDGNLWDDNIFLKRNELLKVAGQCDTNIYFIVSGSLRMYVLDENEEQTIRFGYKGNLITDLEAFLTSQQSSLTIQAIKASELKVISKQKFEDYITKSNEFKLVWIKVLESLIFQQLERERDLLTSSPIERYRRVLERSPQLFQEIPNKYIASYLRMTPETLSRIKKS
jgi:CRP-like cAMP-binding protein